MLKVENVYEKTAVNVPYEFRREARLHLLNLHLEDILI